MSSFLRVICMRGHDAQVGGVERINQVLLDWSKTGMRIGALVLATSFDHAVGSAAPVGGEEDTARYVGRGGADFGHQVQDEGADDEVGQQRSKLPHQASERGAGAFAL